MPETTVFLLDIKDSNSLHGPVRELHQDNGISNQIKSIRPALSTQGALHYLLHKVYIAVNCAKILSSSQGVYHIGITSSLVLLLFTFEYSWFGG